MARKMSAGAAAVSATIAATGMIAPTTAAVDSADEAVAVVASKTTGSALLMRCSLCFQLTQPNRRNDEFDNLPETDDPVEIRNQVRRRILWLAACH
jgi:hypothetical protein